MQGLLVATIFCFFNGEVSKELQLMITDWIRFWMHICGVRVDTNVVHMEKIN